MDARNAMSTLYFIRHGQASFGKENYDELSPRGAAQSRLLAEHFERAGVRFDAVYRGGLARHEGTAGEYLAHERGKGRTVPPVNVLSALDEYDSKAILTALIPVMLEENPRMKEDVERLFTDRRSFQAVFETAMNMWCCGAYDRPGLETWSDYRAKVNGAIDAIMKNDGRGKHVAVFTSGGPITIAAGRTLGLSDATIMGLRDQIVNTSVSRFRCTEERIMLASFNEYSHLELSGDRSMVTYR